MAHDTAALTVACGHQLVIIQPLIDGLDVQAVTLP